MPYKLEKVGGRYFVADDKGKKYSEKPMSKKRALAQTRALYANEKGGDHTSSFSVIKEADGALRWFLYSSSAFRDRDGEIISAKALAEDVKRCDNTKEFGPLRWWHLGGWEAPDGEGKWETWKAGPGIDIGTCDFNMLHGKILIESGTFKSREIGEAVMDAQGELEASIAFSHPEGEPDKEKVFYNIHRFERSLLPAGMASNLLTKLSVVKGESSMDTKGKLAALVAILRNKPDEAKKILSDADAVAKAAEAAGLEFKELEELLSPEATETAATEEVVENTADTVENASETVVEAQAATEQVEETVEEKAAEKADEKQEEIDEIGDMSHEQLKEFVLDIIKEVVRPASDKTTSKQAEIDQSLSDTLASVKGLGERLAKLEENGKKTADLVADLTDSRPIGIKQLMELRPTNLEENVTEKQASGPHLDSDFMTFAKGGK